MQNAKCKRLVFLGPPGSGKGTQAKRLGEEFGLEVIATGDILREAIRQGSELGRKAKRYVEGGGLVPDKLMFELIQEKIKGQDGFILDGFPRTVEQANGLDEITEIDKVVYFKCGAERIVERLSNRRVCPKCGSVYNLVTSPPTLDGVCDGCGTKLVQREDDREGVIRKRVKLYEEKTMPLLDFYGSSCSRGERGSRLIVIDAGAGIEEVYRRLRVAVYE